MKELTTYTRSGKVPHDDAPDSLSLLENNSYVDREQNRGIQAALLKEIFDFYALQWYSERLGIDKHWSIRYNEQ